MVADAIPKVTAPSASQNGGRFRWDVDRYLALVDAGILKPEDRVELIEGEVIQKMSQNPPHVVGMMLLSDALRAVFGTGFRVDSQIPIRTIASVPEPDIVVLRGSARDFLGRLPEAGDIRLAAEVSDSSVAYDRDRKAGIYAHAGIAEYWILNVADRQLEVYRRPLPSGVYGETRVFGLEESVEIEGKSLKVIDLLP